MGKRITTFLLIVAAVLLAVPAGAQTVVAKKTAHSAAMKAPKAIQAKDAAFARAAVAKANEKLVVAEGKQFASAVAAQVAQVRPSKSDAPVGQVYSWPTAPKTPPYVSRSGIIGNGKTPCGTLPNARKVEQFQQLSTTALSARAKAQRKAPTKDDHGIITDPGEGETKYYTRTGTAFYYGSGSVYNEDQSGIVTILEAEGGKVYIKDPVSHYAQGVWVEGTRDGNTITVAGAQPLAWNTNYSTTLSLNWANGQATETGKTFVRGEGDITFTVDDEAGTITLDGSNEDKIIAIFWDDDNSWSGYGDYNSVWTLNTEYEPASTDPIVLPDGAEVQNWYAEGTGSAAVPTDVKVAFVGNEVYISGLTSNFPDAWIKGTLDGTTVTFSKFQFVGMYSGTMPIWAVGADPETGNLQDFTMTYDSEAKTLALDANQLIVFNAAEDRMYYLSYIESLTIYAEEPAPAVIETLPYVNTFDTAAEQKHFTIIDANADGSTWAFYSGLVRCLYSETNQGDDWLVSPAIKLVAGKKYAFSIAAHAKLDSNPERLEVKIAKSNTAEGLTAGAQVIEPTVITSTSFITLSNNELTVAETGEYYIGIHAISDKNQYYLYVDDFVLDAAPITAPYVADFTTEAPFGDFFVIDNNEDGKTWTWSASNFANYTYSSSLAADDYLVLPIKLEASKSYNVIVNAANSGYPEKFEVKVGKEATVEGLSTVAIAETEVTSSDFTDFSGSFTPDEAGTYYVAIHATSDADQFRLKVKTLTIEVGAAGTAPAAVNNLTVTPTENKIEATIVFDAPSVTIDGNEMTENLTKIDVLRDGVVIESVADVAPGSERTIVDNEEKGLTIGTHKYQVIPYNANGIGQKSEEVSVLVTAALSVPYTFDLTQDQTGLFTIIDNNEDGKTWSFSSSIGTIYSYSSTNQGDDYLVSPVFNLEAGKSYKVTVNAKSYNASYTERFEVKVGKVATAEGLNITAIGPTEVSSTEADDFEGEFTVDEAGQYFIAIHAISDPDNWRLVVNSLSIEKGLEPTAPAAPELAVTPAAEGAKSAKIEVTAPSMTIGGDELTAENLSKIEILRDNELLTTLNVLPGNVAEYTDENVSDTLYTYQAIPYDAAGNAGKKSEKVTVYVGVDSPADVQNFHVKSTTATSITFAWDAATGAHGGYVDPTTMKYEISTLKIEQSIFGSYLVVDQAIADVTGQTELTIDFPVDEGEQAYQYFGISANDGKAATDATLAYSAVFVGAPLDIPLFESFEGKSLHYAWSCNGGLGVSTNSSDEDGVALKLYNNGNGEQVYFMLDKVDLTTAANPTLLLDVRSESTDKVYGIGSVDNGDVQVLAQANVTADYTTFKVPLTSIMTAQRFSSVGIVANIETPSVQNYEDTLIIDNIRIVDLYQYDLAIDVKADATVQAGSNAKIVAKVTNNGENAANGYTVIVKAGSKVLLDQTVNETLLPFKSTEFETELPTTIFSEEGDVDILALVSFENDLVEDNDLSTATISVKTSKAAQPTNLAAQQNENEDKVTMTWTAPDTSASQQEDDFSSYANGANATGDLGNWTVVNANGGTKGSLFEDLELPSHGKATAWEVFNLATYGGNSETFAGADGNVDNNYLISLYNATSEGYVDCDDWLISPELPGVAQTLTFDVKAFNDYGAQTYQVLYSTTGKEIADFQLIQEVPDNGGAWSKVSYELPEGTKYFAIRNVTNGDNGFILAVDNISYLVGGSEPVGYNVYVDEEFVKTATETTATVEFTQTKEYKLSVTAVYPGEVESKPVSITVSLTTGIEQLIATGKTIKVYTLDGKYIGTMNNTESLKKGAYIIDNKKVVLK